jgi:putative tryptophan/tyrosine transport system substrate-binding protein
MNRRMVITALLLAAMMRGAHAQQNAPVYRLAIATPSLPVSDLTEMGNQPNYRAFFQKLRELGYVEGQNLSVARYSAEGRTEQFDQLADQVVRGKPDLIFAVARVVRSIKAATDAIPVVTIAGDPVAEGIVSSLARPGGNITGVTIVAGYEIAGKRLEVLREMVPAASRVAWLASHAMWESPDGTTLQGAALRTKISLVGPPLGAPLDEAEYRSVFAAMARDGVDAQIVNGEAVNYANRRLIVELLEQTGLPAIYSFREFADIGGLMVYGPDLTDLYRHAAGQVDQILKGAKPADIPFYQPTKFALTINLKTAKALGLTVPPTLLIGADEVIE